MSSSGYKRFYDRDIKRIQQSSTTTITAKESSLRTDSDEPLKTIESENKSARMYYGAERPVSVDVPAKRQGQEIRTFDSTGSSGRAGEGSLPEMPAEDNTFQASKVEAIIRDTLEEGLKDVRYDAKRCSSLAQELCLLIRERTKQFEFDRCKLVAQVMIGQDTDQSVQISTRCLWNHTTDNFAAATFRNAWIYAVAIVYGLFLE